MPPTLRPLLVFFLACTVLSAAPPATAPADLAQLKARITRLESELADLRAQVSRLQPPAPARAGETLAVPDLRLTDGEWGDAVTDDVAKVCRSAAAELCRHCEPRPLDPLSVHYSVTNSPMIVFGKAPDGSRRVLLNARDRHWAQLAFQFGHEFCHDLCNYREANSANLWFEESLCETASLFVLRRMAETWQTAPPYPNWKGYAPSLATYAGDRLADTPKLGDLTFAQWFRLNETALRKDAHDREKNRVVAAQLLPLLEKNPRHWQACASLNQWDPKQELSFAAYLADWHRRVSAEHKPFVAAIARLFEITL